MQTKLLLQITNKGINRNLMSFTHCSGTGNKSCKFKQPHYTCTRVMSYLIITQRINCIIKAYSSLVFLSFWTRSKTFYFLIYNIYGLSLPFSGKLSTFSSSCKALLMSSTFTSDTKNNEMIQLIFSFCKSYLATKVSSWPGVSKVTAICS